jgi:glucosyl-3-phosphoglycerate synthase
MMADVLRVCEHGRVCQVDIAECYDHKHQDLSENDPQRGLNKMAMDVALCLLRSVAAGQRVFTDSQLNAVVDRYLKIAPEFLKFYAADARMNLLKFDRKLEEHTIELFASSIQRAIASHSLTPLVSAGAPSWNEVEAKLPGFTYRLAEAVKLDNA